MCLNKLEEVLVAADLVSFHLLLCWRGAGGGEMDLLVSVVAAAWWDCALTRSSRVCWMAALTLPLAIRMAMGRVWAG